MTYNAGLDRIEWNGMVPSEGSVTITFQVVLDSPLPNGTVLSNQGTVNWDSDADGTNNLQEFTDDSDTPADDDPTDATVTSKMDSIARLTSILFAFWSTSNTYWPNSEAW